MMCSARAGLLHAPSNVLSSAQDSIPILRQAQLGQHDTVPLHEFAGVRIAHVLRCELVFDLPQALGTEVGLAALPNTRVTCGIGEVEGITLENELGSTLL